MYIKNQDINLCDEGNLLNDLLMMLLIGND